MASASSYLFYGVFVTLPSLLIAANAHEKIAPQLLALDLISLRTRSGNLATEPGCGAVTRMAQELWSLVRVELQDIVWIEAEHELVLSIRVRDLPYCIAECYEYSESGKCSHPLTWEGVMGYADGGERDEEELDNIYSLMRAPFQTMSKDGSKKVLALLEDLHLELITRDDVLPDWEDQEDLHPLVPLGIRGVQQECAAEEEEIPFAAVSDVTALSSVFSKFPRLSSKAKHFKKVVKDFRLEAEDPASKLKPLKDVTLKKYTPKDVTVEEEKRKKFEADGYPSWYLWTQGHLHF